MRRRNQGMKFLSLLCCIMCVAGFVCLHIMDKLQMDIYNAHEWIQVEATYKNSSSYIEKETIEDDEGDTETIEYVRYRWYYDYEINGKSYSCNEGDQINEKPEEMEETRTILVAEDNNSIYMLYESKEAFEKSYHAKSKNRMWIWGAACILIFIMLSAKKLFWRIANNS